MSIVICVIDRKYKIYLASDKRAIKNGIIDDNYQKIYKIRENLYFGMTGIAELGIQILDIIKEFKDLNASTIIKKSSEAIEESQDKLTIMICGKLESGELFCWQKNNSGEEQLIKENNDINFSISSNENINIHSKSLEYQITNYGIKKGILNTIEYASTIDDTISKEYDMIII